MSIRENVSIPVYNYNNNKVIVETNIKPHTFEPCQNDIPSIVYMSFSEINYINGMSNCFRNGLLRFDETNQEEIYTELKIFDYKNIITNQQIKEWLLNPTLKNMSRIISITDTAIFDRVITVYTGLKNSYNNDLSNRVIKTIEARRDEISCGTLKSKIELSPKTTFNQASSTEVEEVKAQNAVLNSKVEEMQKMIEQLLQQKNEPNVSTDDNSDNEIVKPTANKAGRPPKK